MSRMRCCLFGCLVLMSVQVAQAQDRTDRPPALPPLAARLAEVLVGTPPAAAVAFKHPGDADRDCPSACHCTPSKTGSCQPWEPSIDSSAPSPQFCQHMAQLLAVSIQHEDDLETQSKIIQAAMLMVAENAKINAENRFSKLELAHQKELYELKLQVSRNAIESASVAHLRNWVQSFETRHRQVQSQLQSALDTNGRITRTLDQLEQQMLLNTTTPTPTSNRLIRNPTIAKAQFDTDPPQATMQMLTPVIASDEPTESELRAKKLTGEILRLQAELKQLQQDDVKPASHLEPLYSSDQPLRPMYPR